MKLKGGVIIIGSLLWDNKETRREWRSSSLEALERGIRIPLKIRYGRESGTRNCTYTMIFSNDSKTKLGQGYVVGFQRNVWGEKTLEKEAIGVARAEGIWTDTRQVIARDWGAVALLVNGSRPYAAKISSLWKKIFQRSRSKRYCHSQFCFEGQNPVITDAGFLELDPTPKMDDFDFLLAIPTVPKPDRPLTAKQIASRMIEKNYSCYFSENKRNSIKTFQDFEIEALLNN